MTPPIADAADRALISDALDTTLVVEAAAGTGKTTELVKRIVRLVETGRAASMPCSMARSTISSTSRPRRRM